MAGWRRAIALSIEEEGRSELRSIARSRTEPASRVDRARMLLAYRDDPSFFAVGRALGLHHQTVQRCIERAVAHGPLEALEDGPRPGKEPTITPEALPSRPGLEIVRGSALKTDDVSAAVRGVDVLIQTLGVGFGNLFGPVRLFSDSTRVLIAAMQQHGVRRLISVTGFGAGDSRSSIRLIQYMPFVLLLGRACDDKCRQEKLIRDSRLDWTIVRPGMLTNGHATHDYHVLVEPRQCHNGLVSRADVADFRVGQITDRTLLRKATVLVY